MTHIVGINGLAQSGKDTLAGFLIRMTMLVPEVRARRFAFADTLKSLYARAVHFGEKEEEGQIYLFNSTSTSKTDKDYLMGEFVTRSPEFKLLGPESKAAICGALMKMDLVRPYDPRNEEHKKTHRKDLIDFGMALRIEDPNFWVNLTLDEIKGQSKCVDIAIITDVRFENELEICDTIVRIDRDGIEPIVIDGKIPASEQLATWDYINVGADYVIYNPADNFYPLKYAASCLFFWVLDNYVRKEEMRNDHSDIKYLGASQDLRPLTWSGSW